MTPQPRPSRERLPISTCIILLCALVASTGTFFAYRHLSSGAAAEPQQGQPATSSPLLRAPLLRFEPLSQGTVQQQRQRELSDAVHIVFSTSCSPSQDWQSFVLMFSAAQVGHSGPVTRIASGCSEKEQREVRETYAKAFPNYHVHFTPDFSVDEATGQQYHFYNKPFGMQHWLAHSERPIKESVIALLDPDMVLTRPLTADLAADANLVMHTKDITAEKIVRGRPAGQEYGLGGPWTIKEHMFNRRHICGEGSPCLLTTESDANAHYAVGPPYIAHPDDMRSIVDKWTEFVPRVFEGYPYLLAEMYAYSMAAAHLQLPHITVDNYMVSDIRYGVNGEGWPAVQRLADVCPASLDQFSGWGPLGPTRLAYGEQWVPPVLHYCQFYRLGAEGFNKRLVPNDLFSCASTRYMVEPDSSITALRYKAMGGGKTEPMTERDAIRSAFMLCTVPRFINDAIAYYRRTFCGSSAERAPDEHKTVRADHPRV